MSAIETKASGRLSCVNMVGCEFRIIITQSTPQFWSTSSVVEKNQPLSCFDYVADSDTIYTPNQFVDCLKMAREKSTRTPVQTVELKHGDFEDWKKVGKSFFKVLDAVDENGGRIKFRKTRMWIIRKRASSWIWVQNKYLWNWQKSVASFLNICAM